jgi:hypothetical protein
LKSRRFRHGGGNKVYSGHVSNGKDFLPIHIAAMSTKCQQNTIRILRTNFEHSFFARTSDGSLPLHLVTAAFFLNCHPEPWRDAISLPTTVWAISCTSSSWGTGAGCNSTMHYKSTQT